MNAIARLEYELRYYDAAVRHFNHYTTRTPQEKEGTNINCRELTDGEKVNLCVCCLKKEEINWRVFCYKRIKGKIQRKTVQEMNRYFIKRQRKRKWGRNDEHTEFNNLSVLGLFVFFVIILPIDFELQCFVIIRGIFLCVLKLEDFEINSAHKILTRVINVLKMSRSLFFFTQCRFQCFYISTIFNLIPIFFSNHLGYIFYREAILIFSIPQTMWDVKRFLERTPSLILIVNLIFYLVVPCRILSCILF